MSKTITILLISFVFVGCSSVKKTQQSTTETEKNAQSNSIDSVVKATVENNTGKTETESLDKETTIIFPDEPKYTIDPEEYFRGDDSSFIRIKASSSTVINTNKSAAVILKANGDILLNERPKSISVKDKSNKQKIDTSSSKQAMATEVKKEESKVEEKKKVETSRTVRISKFLSWWWLLVLLIPAGWYSWKKKTRLWLFITKLFA